jgi:hypothetical protein
MDGIINSIAGLRVIMVGVAHDTDKTRPIQLLGKPFSGHYSTTLAALHASAYCKIKST